MVINGYAKDKDGKEWFFVVNPGRRDQPAIAGEASMHNVQQLDGLHHGAGQVRISREQLEKELRHGMVLSKPRSELPMSASTRRFAWPGPAGGRGLPERDPVVPTPPHRRLATGNDAQRSLRRRSPRPWTPERVRQFVIDTDRLLLAKRGKVAEKHLDAKAIGECYGEPAYTMGRPPRSLPVLESAADRPGAGAATWPPTSAADWAIRSPAPGCR